MAGQSAVEYPEHNATITKPATGATTNMAKPPFAPSADYVISSMSMPSEVQNGPLRNAGKTPINFLVHGNELMHFLCTGQMSIGIDFAWGFSKEERTVIELQGSNGAMLHLDACAGKLGWIIKVEEGDGKGRGGFLGLGI